MISLAEIVGCDLPFPHGICVPGAYRDGELLTARGLPSGVLLPTNATYVPDSDLRESIGRQVEQAQAESPEGVPCGMAALGGEGALTQALSEIRAHGRCNYQQWGEAACAAAWSIYWSIRRAQSALSGLGSCVAVPANPNCAGVCPPGYCWTGHCDTTKYPAMAICVQDTGGSGAGGAYAPPPAPAPTYAPPPAPAVTTPSPISCRSGEVLVGGVCVNPLIEAGAPEVKPSSSAAERILRSSRPDAASAGSKPAAQQETGPGGVPWSWIAAGALAALLLSGGRR
jgi:hypothetical protein